MIEYSSQQEMFFGMPLMCVGELTWKKDKTSVGMLIISGTLLTAEIAFVGSRVMKGSDRSMYIMLPMFIYYLLLAFRSWNPDVDTSDFGGNSSAIYLIQFGIITFGEMVIIGLNIQSYWASWGIYLLVLFIPSDFYKLIRQTKLSHILF